MRNQDWPVEEFRDYLDATMRACGIPHDAALARAAGLDPSLLSNWRNGKAQPSRRSLKKLASPLRVPPVNLYLAAGLDDEEDLDISGQHDLSVIAPEYRALLDFDRDDDTSDVERTYVRQVIRTLLAGIRAERLPESRPNSRRRSA